MDAAVRDGQELEPIELMPGDCIEFTNADGIPIEVVVTVRARPDLLFPRPMLRA